MLGIRDASGMSLGSVGEQTQHMDTHTQERTFKEKERPRRPHTGPVDYRPGLQDARSNSCIGHRHIHKNTVKLKSEIVQRSKVLNIKI